MIDIFVDDNKICLGRQGENLVARVVFDIENWINEHGKNGTVKLINLRPGEFYPDEPEIQVEGNKAYWIITDTETNISGEGRCELQYHLNNLVVKSEVYTTCITPSLFDVGIRPTSSESWVNKILTAANLIEEQVPQIQQAANEAKEAADKAIAASTRQPYIGENGNWYLWNYNDNTYYDSGISAFAPDSVRYNEKQELNDNQKFQARENIGAGTSNFSGDWSDLENKPSLLTSVPLAESNTIGGMKADPVEEEDTQPVRIGGDGKLYTQAQPKQTPVTDWGRFLRTTKLDFTKWDEGQIVEYVEYYGQPIVYTVTKDVNGKPTSISFEGHTIEVVNLP